MITDKQLRLYFCVAHITSMMPKTMHADIFNTDQGSQFTSKGFTGVLKEHNIKISMDGRGRCQ